MLGQPRMELALFFGKNSFALTIAGLVGLVPGPDDVQSRRALRPRREAEGGGAGATHDVLAQQCALPTDLLHLMGVRTVAEGWRALKNPHALRE